MVLAVAVWAGLFQFYPYPLRDWIDGLLKP